MKQTFASLHYISVFQQAGHDAFSSGPQSLA